MYDNILTFVDGLISTSHEAFVVLPADLQGYEAEGGGYGHGSGHVVTADSATRGMRRKSEPPTGLAGVDSLRDGGRRLAVRRAGGNLIVWKGRRIDSQTVTKILYRLALYATETIPS